MSAAFSNLPKKPLLSRALLSRMENAVLGPRYDLSIAFVSQREIQRLNRVYRGKNRPTDILAFPLRASAGELILCPAEARRHASPWGQTPTQYLLFLLIHGLLHLKGMAHGARMEREERKFQKRFGI